MLNLLLRLTVSCTSCTSCSLSTGYYHPLAQANWSPWRGQALAATACQEETSSEAARFWSLPCGALTMSWKIIKASDSRYLMTHGDPEAFLVIHASPDDIHPTPWGQFLSIPLEFFAAIAGRDLAEAIIRWGQCPQFRLHCLLHFNCTSPGLFLGGATAAMGENCWSSLNIIVVSVEWSP